MVLIFYINLRTWIIISKEKNNNQKRQNKKYIQIDMPMFYRKINKYVNSNSFLWELKLAIKYMTHNLSVYVISSKLRESTITCYQNYINSRTDVTWKVF